MRAADDADAGLVAARLDAEHEGRVAVHVPPRVGGAAVGAHRIRAGRRPGDRGRHVEPHHDRVDVVGLVVAAAQPISTKPSEA